MHLNLPTILDSIKWNNYPPFPPKQWWRREWARNAPFWHHWNGGEGWSRCSIYFVQDCNLGQYKMEQLFPIPPPPPPKAMMKARRSKKRAILASLKWGEGWSRCSIYFVQDCRVLNGLKFSGDSMTALITRRNTVTRCMLTYLEPRIDLNFRVTQYQLF